MIDELNKKFNEAMQAAVFDQNSKCENEVNISNVKPIDKDLKEEKTIKELIQKLLEANKWYNKWYNEQLRKNKPAIIIDSQGRFVNTYGYGTLSFLDYVKAVEEGQVKIKDKEYRKIIMKLIKNNK